MKSVWKIYRHYVCSACLLVAGVLLINLIVFLGYVIRSSSGAADSGADAQGIRFGGYQRVADLLTALPDGGYRMEQEGVDALREGGYAFALLLDETGEAVWEWQKPEEVPDRFSAGEIGAFSKWYLMDYPVSVWRYGAGGLLVFGYPKGSIVRHNMVWHMEELEMIIRYAGIFLAANGILFFALALFAGYRFYRMLKPVGEGIDALAQGRSVWMRENGSASYLKEKINRTSELLERQRRELERRDTARTEWIAGVSHDIRTPLSLIMGYADELEKDMGIPPEMRRKAGLIRQQSFAIKKLIEDLNLTSRLTYHMKPLRRERYCPAVLLRRTAADMINSGEIGSDRALELDVDPKLETLRLTGDTALLTRALKNLLGNSVRHNPDGCRIRLEARETERGFCFCVADDGAGVPEPVRRIALGQEADAAPKDRAPHVMGLLVVARIAEAHGGRLWFERDGKEVWMSAEDAGE